MHQLNTTSGTTSYPKTSSGYLQKSQVSLLHKSMQNNLGKKKAAEVKTWILTVYLRGQRSRYSSSVRNRLLWTAIEIQSIYVWRILKTLLWLQQKELQQILLCQAKKGHCTMPSKYDPIHFSILQCTTHCCTANGHVMDIHKVLLL